MFSKNLHFSVLLVFILKIVTEIFENEILWTKLNSVNLKGKIILQHCKNIYIFCGGGGVPLNPPIKNSKLIFLFFILPPLHIFMGRHFPPCLSPVYALAWVSLSSEINLFDFFISDSLYSINRSLWLAILYE